MDAFLTMASRRDESEEIADLVITGLNARAAAMLSMPREELLGKRLSELEHSVEADVLLDKCLRVVRKGTPLEEEILLPAPPGQASRPGTWVHHQIVPIQGGVAVTMRDTTDRKRLEDQLRQSIERLEAYAEELEGKNRMLAEENAERERTASVLRQQQEAIRALSTPIIQAWEGVLVLPIIGALDSGRATQIMEKLLGEVVRTQAHFAVLDLTGVEDVDAPTVDHLLQVARAASLLGSRCLISGISPGVAQAIVQLGSDARTFETFGELEDALRHALRVSGARLPRLGRGKR
jgi:anti-anti-sigma regulatory factor